LRALGLRGAQHGVGVPGTRRQHAEGEQHSDPADPPRSANAQPCRPRTLNGMRNGKENGNDKGHGATEEANPMFSTIGVTS